MRIIAGKHKGRVLAETHGNRTHPMSEKIRGALFNSLGDITGLSVLDAFSGTGTVAIEAASRGANYVQAIDIDKEAFRCMQKNVAIIGCDKVVKTTQANTSSWSDNKTTEKFNIVIADPPHDGVQVKLIKKLSNHVTEGGVLVLCIPVGMSVELGDSYKELAEKNYGNAKLVFYRAL